MNSTPYDFVVIGGGTAGLVVASRLSEIPTQRILVLEAGSDFTDDPRVKIPGLYETLKTKDTSWDFKTEPQVHMNGRCIPVDQGRLLGGSSAMNAQVFAPPTKSSINAWESLGNSGWNWESLKEYYYKTFTPPLVDASSKKVLGIQGWEGDSVNAKGPVQTSFPGNISHPVREAWAETFKAKGYYIAQDPFSEPSVGAFSCLASIDSASKERSHAASTYYQPIKHRSNLTVITKAVVQKIIFTEDSCPKAVAVKYQYGGETITITASKEVIVAAGALQSPKILELSGIGDAQLLKQHGLHVVEDLPDVGENLQDHIVCGLCFEANEEMETFDDLIRQDPAAVAQSMEDYATNQTGLMTSVGITTYAYLPVMNNLWEPGQEVLRDLFPQYYPARGKGTTQLRDQAFHEIAEKILLDPKEPSGSYLSVFGQNILPIDPSSDSPVGPVPGKWLTLAAFLSHPLSRGSVHIKSGDATMDPKINPDYLSSPIDSEVFAHHMSHLKTIAAAPPLTDLLKKPLKNRDPASTITDLDSAKKYIRTSAISMWHLCGTCAMLPREKGGVVDTQLKVYGVERLRVVDASVFPTITNTNTQTTVYAVAEKAADLIKKEYGLE